jgi:ubiquinone/menaquinone biosynthesis C-methylase UbiE
VLLAGRVWQNPEADEALIEKLEVSSNLLRATPGDANHPRHERRGEASMNDPNAGTVATQHQAIREEYRRQAPRWGKAQITEYLRWVVEQLPLSPELHVADIAAGTGLFSRAIAPLVSRVTAVDITPEMLEQGRARAAESGLANIEFREGAAEALPFPDDAFDAVVTRYSLHHFLRPEAAVKEMARVVRPKGAVKLVDMMASEDSQIAERQNALETLMDKTHTRMLSPNRFVETASGSGLTLQTYVSREVPMHFEHWQSQVPADSPARGAVRDALNSELSGGAETGFRPLIRDGALWFLHIWGVLIARKAR